MDLPIDPCSRHFGFNQKPFAMAPDPSFMFWSPSHKRAAETLDYGLMTCAPITLMTGETGSGKTTVLRHIMQSASPKLDDLHVGLVSQPMTDPVEALRWILQALDQPVSQELGHAALYRQLENCLVDHYARGARVALIFDEAQCLGLEVLDQLRMLTNINAETDELLQIVLVGQPALRSKLEDPRARQISHRVTADIQLDRLTQDSIPSYILHRIACAGGSPDVFEEASLALIQDSSDGTPRLVNKTCDAALYAAFHANEVTVKPSAVRKLIGCPPEAIGVKDPRELARAS